MRFKAVLVGALVRPFGKGDPLPWQTFQPTQYEAEKLGEQVLKGLTPEQRKTAYVKVSEVTEVLVSEIHTAAEKGPDGEVAFAYARHDGQKTIGA